MADLYRVAAWCLLYFWYKTGASEVLFFVWANFMLGHYLVEKPVTRINNML
jgi:hypothetical protein